MSNEKKGITVKIDADLHAEIRQYVESKGMTMAQFIEQAVDNELHPKFNNNMEENKSMEKMRTLAFQVPEDLFQKVKAYLDRNHISQKQFVIGLIEREIDRDLTERAELKAAEQPDEELDEEQDEAVYNEEIIEDDAEQTEDEPTEDELTEDEPTEDEDIEQTDGEFDEADEDEDIDQGDEQDEDEEESEDEEFSEDEEESEGMTMSGM